MCNANARTRARERKKRIFCFLFFRREQAPALLFTTVKQDFTAKRLHPRKRVYSVIDVFNFS